MGLARGVEWIAFEPVRDSRVEGGVGIVKNRHAGRSPDVARERSPASSTVRS